QQAAEQAVDVVDHRAGGVPVGGEGVEVEAVGEEPPLPHDHEGQRPLDGLELVEHRVPAVDARPVEAVLAVPPADDGHPVAPVDVEHGGTVAVTVGPRRPSACRAVRRGGGDQAGSGRPAARAASPGGVPRGGGWGGAGTRGRPSRPWNRSPSGRLGSPARRSSPVWTIRWWAEHSATRLSGSVGPPCRQWTTWWTWSQRRWSHPGTRQPPSRCSTSVRSPGS